MDSSDEDLHLPDVQDVAKSFLLDEPLDKRRELEALVYTDDNVAESVINESTKSNVGTGLGIGMPGFLATFLQGMVDKLKVQVRNVQISVETEIKAEPQESMDFLQELRAYRNEDTSIPPRTSASILVIRLDMLHIEEVTLIYITEHWQTKLDRS